MTFSSSTGQGWGMAPSTRLTQMVVRAAGAECA